MIRIKCDLLLFFLLIALTSVSQAQTIVLPQQCDCDTAFTINDTTLVIGTDTLLFGHSIYTGNGTTPTNLHVQLSDRISFDTSTLVLDALDNRVGIGTSTPTEKLEVDGNLKISGAFMPNNSAGTSGQVLTSTGLNTAPIWSDFPASNVGSTSILLNGNSFERAALIGDVTAPANSNSTTISDNAVTSAKIADGTIAETDLANNSVSATKIMTDAVNGDKIEDGSIGTVDLANGIVTEEKLANNAVSTLKIADGAITQSKLASMGASNGQLLKWNGTSWTPSEDNNTPSLYTSSGLLSDHTTVNMGNFRLDFSALESNAFSVDGSTFSVDAASNEVGIGTTNPSSKLEVADLNAILTLKGLDSDITTGRMVTLLRFLDQNSLYAGGVGFNTTSGSMKMANSISNGDLILEVVSSGIPRGALTIKADTRRIGIFDSFPGQALSVNGGIDFTGSLNMSGDAGLDGQILTSRGPGLGPQWMTAGNGIYSGSGIMAAAATVNMGSNTLQFDGNITNAFSIDNQTFSVDAANNRVGIGTAAPKATLEVIGNASLTGEPDGFMPPKMTGDQLAAKNAAYGAEQEGIMVFITAPASAANQTGKTTNVNSKGMYYYDHDTSLWIKI